ncbi:Repeat domain-containing protein [Cnuella takakiae]|uniref:Repeat domain-containing protein n=1 Tax=Cnuella takakiae TaxID=1302690 RepID=A0A1M5AY72_9BACT|nr:VCBS repeat-containing protein [Cnuella takakiae]OLY93267.1 hypothetical protein BUE76_16260 [Cnuella takakiae]SHF35153.1 Repeat domain-containing protein [Cnuella takakiae]
MKSFLPYLLLLLTACHTRQAEQLFTVMDTRTTGVAFQNTLNLTDTFNILDYLYYYNGGGVAIGDLDNDGLDDLYFSSNRESNKLYHNKGNLLFEDLAETAGVKGNGNWKTGVTMADVNGDGLLDIYLCAVGGYKSLQGHNQLFINQGGMRFSEEAETYGLDVEGFNTQASFFDYDLDGDLDMFLVNHSVHTVESYGDSSLRNTPNAAAGDKLFRNNGPHAKPRFAEVTQEAGIYNSALGYGLNVLTTDFTGDGWPDIYVSNDFHEHDYYYVNQRNGSFSEIGQKAFGHFSRFSMGSDAADINGDGAPDILTLDMLPEDEAVLKASAGDDPLDIYQFKTERGYHHQLARNCLQLNNGNGAQFRDIALYSGISATDWSWSPLLADFDNDGIRDLFVANGIPRRPNDLDFIKYVSSGSMQAALQEGKDADAAAIALMPEGAVSNRLFQGSASLRFRDAGNEWGISTPSISTGAAYSDLDGDGDLDIVTNNLNAPASIYRNNSRQQSGNNWLAVELKSEGANKKSVGATVSMWQNGVPQTLSVMPTRGFQSASSTILHFGLGKTRTIDSLRVQWPDGSVQVLQGVTGNRRLVINKQVEPLQKPGLKKQLPALAPLANFPDWQHQENDWFDFNQQQLIPHAQSALGPAMASADVDGNGFPDLFVGGCPGQAGALFLQKGAGQWMSPVNTPFAADAESEDVSALFFDANGDKKPDLYVVSGGNEWPDTSSLLQDRLYLNTSGGQFKKASLPAGLGGNRSTVCAADIDKDGDQDLFVGSRAIGGSYGAAPLSHLLLNDGSGQFAIAAPARAPGLQRAGMITSAVFTDINHDDWPDLVLAGEWMPLTVFINHKGILHNETAAMGLAQSSGIWQCLYAGDLNGDGWPELVAGNWGLNSKLTASPQDPLLMYVGDADGNGATEQLLSINKGGKYFPFLGKEELEKAMPSIIRKKYPDYSSMAGQTMESIFGTKLQSMQRHSVHTLASLLVKNNQGKLTLTNLPPQVQWAPITAIAAGDCNGDGKKDLFMAGNHFGVLPYEGRYDAGGVQLLLQGAGGQWRPQPVAGTPSFTQISHMVWLDAGIRKQLLLAQNNGPVLGFVLSKANTLAINR